MQKGLEKHIIFRDSVPEKKPPGVDIADTLNISYDGVQEGIGMQFTDPVTYATFYADTVEQAEARLKEKRELFANAKPE